MGKVNDKEFTKEGRLISFTESIKSVDESISDWVSSSGYSEFGDDLASGLASLDILIPMTLKPEVNMMSMIPRV